MLRKKCKKTCLHALLKLVLSRAITKTLPMASRCIACTLVRRRASRVRARIATLHADPRARSFYTLARHPITTRVGASQERARPAARVIMLSEKPHGQRLCGRCTDTCATCAAVREHVSARAGNWWRASSPACVTQSPARTRDARLPDGDDSRHRRRASTLDKPPKSDARTQRFASKQQRANIKALRLSKAATRAKHRGNTSNAGRTQLRRQPRDRCSHPFG
ncbi:hypothetical protein MNJPNG_15855 [Cupriavidus oxalaticus]